MQDDFEMEHVKVKIFGHTDKGQVRPHNEDNLIVGEDISREKWTRGSNQELIVNTLGVLLVVADGMGGAAAGEIASGVCIETIKAQFNQLFTLPESDEAILNYLKSSIYNAHLAIVKEADANQECEGMGTTVNVGLIVHNKLYIAWSGDSRIYRYSPKGISRKKAYDSDFMEILTPDHSQVWEQVEQGKMTAEQARVDEFSNIITQSLGDKEDPPRPDVKILYIREGDRIVACSDGLNSMLPDFKIEDILAKQLDPEVTCIELITAANTAGGSDNITVIVADVLTAPTLPIEEEINPQDSINQDTRQGKHTVLASNKESSFRKWVKWVTIGLLPLLCLFVVAIKISNEMAASLDKSALDDYKKRKLSSIKNLKGNRDELLKHENFAYFSEKLRQFDIEIEKIRSFVELDTTATISFQDTNVIDDRLVQLQQTFIKLEKDISTYTPSQEKNKQEKQNSKNPDKRDYSLYNAPKTGTLLIQNVEESEQQKEKAAVLEENIKQNQDSISALIKDINATLSDIEKTNFSDKYPSFNKEQKLRELRKLLHSMKNWANEPNKKNDWIEKVKSGMPDWRMARESVQKELDGYKDSLVPNRSNAEQNKQAEVTDTITKGN